MAELTVIHVEGQTMYLVDEVDGVIAERDKTIAEYDAMIEGMADANLAMRKRIEELEDAKLMAAELDCKRTKRIAELEAEVKLYSGTYS